MLSVAPIRCHSPNPILPSLDQELKETRKKLEELTEKRDDLGKETQKMRDDLTEAQEEIKRSSRELKDLKARVKGTVDEKDSLSGVGRSLVGVVLWSRIDCNPIIIY